MKIFKLKMISSKIFYSQSFKNFQCNNWITVFQSASCDSAVVGRRRGQKDVPCRRGRRAWQVTGADEWSVRRQEGGEQEHRRLVWSHVTLTVMQH